MAITTNAIPRPTNLEPIPEYELNDSEGGSSVVFDLDGIGNRSMVTETSDYLLSKESSSEWYDLSQESPKSEIFTDESAHNNSFMTESDTWKILKEIEASKINEIPERLTRSTSAIDNHESFLNDPDNHYVTESDTSIQYSNCGAGSHMPVKEIPADEIPAKALQTQQDLNQSVISEISEYQESEMRLTPAEYEDLAWDFIGGLWMLAVAFINIYATHYTTLAMEHIPENASWAGFYL